MNTRTAGHQDEHEPIEPVRFDETASDKPPTDEVSGEHSVGPETREQFNQEKKPEPFPLREKLPEAFRDHECFDKVESLEDLAKLAVERYESSKNLERVLGKKLDRLARDDVLSMLGRPDTPDSYDFSGIELSEGLSWDAGLEAKFREWAYDSGLTKQQARDLGTQFAAHVVAAGAQKSADSVAARRAAAHEAHQTLRRDWGTATDARIAEAHSALARFGSSDLLGRLNNAGLGHDPDLLRFVDQALAGVEDKQGEDTGIQPSGGNAPPGDREAHRRIEARYTDHEFMHAYTAPNHPRHAAAVSEMQTLFQASRS